MGPRLQLRWPLPAVLAWFAAWAVYRLMVFAGASSTVGFLAASLLGIILSLLAATWWRRLMIAGGFPLALLASGAAMLPGWGWLLLLLLLVLLYPIRTWRDAPLYPTPADALRGLADHAPLPPGALVLDAGCGLGDGLNELRAVYPLAKLHGLEWSWLLCAVCALRCRWAVVRQGDIWTADWAPYRLVYLFQRPESMPRAAAKAAREMQPGSWLVSLEFGIPGIEADQALSLANGRKVWLYRTR